MSKTRALELCDEACRCASCAAEAGPSSQAGILNSCMLYMRDAIRELAKDEPAEAIDELAKTDPEATTLDEVVDRLDELIKAVHSLTEVCSDISRHTYDG